jgi:transcriptional regulator with XRE-family HTH domain
LTFGNYLKKCRTKYNLTQEELVSKLYSFDNIFNGLDVRTLSRWENSQTNPPPNKQIHIIKFFTSFCDEIFPCFDDETNIEKHLCLKGIKNILGHSKEHIINFPENIFKVDDIEIKQLYLADKIENLLEMPKDIFSTMTSDTFNITKKDLKKFASYPSNLFLVAQVKQQFMGMFFCLKLKPSSFEKLLSLELKVSDLEEKDFATASERGSIFHLSFFTYNETIASLFYIRYYAYLIKNQKYILDIGTTAVLESAKKLLEKLNIKHLKDIKYKDKNISIHKSTLEDVLLNENNI